jgi:hypothetical protein
MVNTHNRRAEVVASYMNGQNPPPPPSLAQAIASILESHDEQTELLQQLMANFSHDGNGARNAPAPASITYGDFTATHPSIFTEAGEPLEADHWLQVIETKFGLLHYTKVQKTLFTTRQLRGDTSAWWANYTAAHPVDYQVPWAKFYSTFHTHHIPADMMRRKYQEFMDQKQGERFVHNYTKLLKDQIKRLEVGK